MSRPILVVDTATPRIVAGVVDAAGEPVALSSIGHDGVNKHAEVLAPSIREAVSQAATTLDDLRGIVVGLGPGPFTGLRVGIVTAASLSHALGIPAWGVCTLDALNPADGRTLVVTDARRKELYFALYDGDRRVSGPSVASAGAIVADVGQADRVVQAGAYAYLDALQAIGPIVESPVDPLSLVRAAVREDLLDGGSTALQPIYLRRPDAAEPKKRPALDVTGPRAQ